MIAAATNRDSLRKRYPGLSGLRLADEDFEVLPDQGFISEETSDSRIYHKLRFRRKDGKQVVRYIPRDAVEAVRRDLAALQRCRTAKRALKGLEHDGRAMLRAAGKQMQSLGERYGLHFHGHAVRKRRGFGAWTHDVSATCFYLKEENMEGFEPTVSAAAERRAADKLGTDAAYNPADDDSSAEFFARLEELRAGALENPDTEDACRQHIKADFMKLVHLATQGLTAIVESDPKAFVLNTQVSEAADRHIGYMREYNRFENLDVRIAEVRAAAEKAARNDPLRARPRRIMRR